MSGGSRTPHFYGWRKRRLQLALTPEDWRLVEAGAMHKGESVSRFLGDLVAEWAKTGRLNQDRIDGMVKRRGLITPLEVP